MKQLAHNKLSEREENVKHTAILYINHLQYQIARFLALVRKILIGLCVSLSTVCIGSLSIKLYIYLILYNNASILDAHNPL